MADALLTPILDTANPTVHYFEGRLLTARDLREQQSADRARREMLGRAIGTGIVEGLEVSVIGAGAPGASPEIQIAAGVALNPLGQLLVLGVDQNLTLSEVGEAGAEDAGLFRTCDPAGSSATFTGFGVYVLVMSPASGFAEYAPKIELGDEGIASGCGRRYALEGVRFRLVELPLADYPDIGQAQSQVETATTQSAQVRAVSRLRSVVAHAFLRSAGTAHHRARLRAGGPTVFGNPNAGLERLVQLEAVSRCDVPLAVLFWDTDSLRFVDNWAARRLARWTVSADDVSLFPASGLERLLQFQTHVAELLPDVATPLAATIVDYFRYLPPAGFFPVQGDNSSSGFSTTNFMGDYVDQLAASLTAGQLTRLLDESLAFETLDLREDPYLQLYSVTQNSAAVAATDASQLVRAFATRDLNGPMLEDGLAAVFDDTWDAYRSLIRRRELIPFGRTIEATQARFAIAAALRDVMDVANRVAAQAGGGSLDVTGAAVAFLALHEIQSDLIAVFQDGLPGNDLPGDIAAFTLGLAVLVDGGIAASSPGLAQAVQVGDLKAMTSAQRAINDYVRGWQSGGTGFFGFELLDSVRGASLTPGDDAEWRFVFSNERSQKLNFDLRAKVAAPSGTWPTFGLRNERGKTLTSIRLGAGESVIVSARFRAPADAATGETAELMLRAKLAATGETADLDIEIPIKSDGGDPLRGNVSFAGPPELPDRTTGVAPGTVLKYRFPVRYRSAAGPSARKFNFSIAFAGADTEGWHVAINGIRAEADGNGVFTRRVTLHNANTLPISTPVRVAIQTPDRAGVAVQFSAGLQSASGAEPMSATLETPLSISLARR